MCDVQGNAVSLGDAKKDKVFSIDGADFISFYQRTSKTSVSASILEFLLKKLKGNCFLRLCTASDVD